MCIEYHRTSIKTDTYLSYTSPSVEYFFVYELPSVPERIAVVVAVAVVLMRVPDVLVIFNTHTILLIKSISSLSK